MANQSGGAVRSAVDLCRQRVNTRKLRQMQSYRSLAVCGEKRWTILCQAMLQEVPVGPESLVLVMQDFSWLCMNENYGGLL